MPAEMRFIVKENIIRGMYDNGNLMIYAAADGVKDNKNSCICSECVSEKGEKIPRDTPYAMLVESTAPVVAQYSRLDTSAVEMALMTTIAYPVE